MNVYIVEISSKNNMNLKIQKKLYNIKNNTFNTTRIKLMNLEKLILKTEEKEMLIFVYFLIQDGEFIML